MKFFISVLLLFSTFVAMSASDDSAVQEEENFQELSVQMKNNNMGLVMMLHAEDCHYCEIMDENILSPMERSGEYKKRVFIRKLQIDKLNFITDFKGNRIAASDLAESYDSRLTPTLIFLDHTGEEKAVKIIGINSIDLFSASVDEQIDELLMVINNKNKSPSSN
ncbi:MAG: thioredoxin-related protein [Cocleimonas sp.]|jgi:thioredoxin-related protein